MTTEQQRQAKARKQRKIGAPLSILRPVEDVVWLWDYNRNAVVEYVWGFRDTDEELTRYVYGGESTGFYEISEDESEILGVIGTEGMKL